MPLDSCCSDRSNGGVSTPESVMNAVTRSCGVTSNAGLRTLTAAGAVARPNTRRTSSGSRSSMTHRRTVRSRRIERGRRTRDIERNAEMPRKNSDAGRADLVDDVAVARHAIGADQNQIDRAFGHHPRHHRVADERHVDAGLHQLPRGETAALQQRPRFARIHAKRDAGRVRQIHRRGSGAEFRYGQCAGIAMRQHAAARA